MMKDEDKDLLAEAIVRLRQEGLSQEPPPAVVGETIRRLGAAGAGTKHVAFRAGVGARNRRFAVTRATIRLALAAAASIALGFALGRFSGPAPVNVDELREALAPSLAASIEPAIRARLIDDMQQRYQVALTATYVQVKEELTAQYQDELNRMAVQMLAASNAVTNRLLTELVENIDTAQTQDLRRITRALYEIEVNRIQDRTQLATGLQTLASRTEETRRAFAQWVGNVRPDELDMPGTRSIRIPDERNEP
jgi:hypothetical protein